MKNWYDIIPPHADIRKAHFDEAVFAADLGDVAAEAAPGDYRPTLNSDTMPALVTEVGGKMSNTLWHLKSRGEDYFSRIPNLNRMILDKKELFRDSYEHRLSEVIEDEIGPKFRPYLWPETTSGRDVSAVIPDNRALKLIILHPDDDGAQIPTWIERHGEGFRDYKNTLFFALADTGAFVKLREDVKTILALKVDWFNL